MLITRKISGNYLGEACIDKQIKKPAKQLVAHQNRDMEIAQNESPGVTPGVRPVPRCSEDEPNHVQRDRDHEEFTV